MTNPALPLKGLLPDHVQELLPDNYSGSSENEYLVSIFSELSEHQEISQGLVNMKSLSHQAEFIFDCLVETFPDVELDSYHFWSLNIQESEEAFFWFRMGQSYGNIIDNGIYISLRNAQREYRKAMNDDSLYLNEEIIGKSLDFTKFLISEGSYSSISDCYFFLNNVNEEETLRLMAAGLSFDEYKKYCNIGCTTYDEIYNGTVSELPDEWVSFLLEQVEGEHEG